MYRYPYSFISPPYTVGPKDYLLGGVFCLQRLIRHLERVHLENVTNLRDRERFLDWWVFVCVTTGLSTCSLYPSGFGYLLALYLTTSLRFPQPLLTIRNDTSKVVFLPGRTNFKTVTRRTIVSLSISFLLKRCFTYEIVHPLSGVLVRNRDFKSSVKSSTSNIEVDLNKTLRCRPG